MGAGNSCVPPHTPVVCPMWPAMVSGMGCNCGPCRHMPGIFGPKICLAYARMPLLPPKFPCTAALREWVLERCRPGFKERASASSSTRCMEGLSPVHRTVLMYLRNARHMPNRRHISKISKSTLFSTQHYWWVLLRSEDRGGTGQVPTDNGPTDTHCTQTRWKTP